MVTNLLFRIAHAVRASPWLQVVLGAVLLIAGALAVFFGAGHGGLIVFGVIVLVGGATAIRGANARAHQIAEREQSPEAPQSR